MTRRILAVDPGMTTGLCFAQLVDTDVTLHVWQERLTFVGLWRLIEKVGPQTIIIEDFEVRQRTPAGIDMFPAHLVGVTKLYAEFHGTEIIVQAAKIGKSHYNGEGQLRKEGVYIPGAGYQHSMDAVRHFMQWFNFRGGYKYYPKIGRAKYTVKKGKP